MSRSDLDVEDLIADEDMVVTITHTGYVKRIPVAAYRAQKRGGKGVSGVNLKEDDVIDEMFIASTHEYVLFFSSKGKVYRLKVHELPVGTRQGARHRDRQPAAFRGGREDRERHQLPRVPPPTST